MGVKNSNKMDLNELRDNLKDLKRETSSLSGRLGRIIDEMDDFLQSQPRINPNSNPTNSPHRIGKYVIKGKTYYLRQSHETIDKTKPVVFIDEGHGGLDENGNYTTPSSYGKRFKHNPAIVDGGMDKDGKGWIYEGVLNRELVVEFCWHLKQKEIQFIIISDYIKDVSLDDRVDIVNFLYQIYNKGFLISVHCNAFRGESTGSCLFTTRHQSTSDIIAQHIAPYLYELEEYWRSKGFWVRDGSEKVNEIDYEKNFTILMCDCPAVMTEVLFFDNERDIKMLIDKNFRFHFMEKFVWGLGSYLTNQPIRPLPKR